MAKDRHDPFRDHVAELLAPIGDVRVRAMFGGYGVYRGDQMFGLIAEGTLNLKVDADNEARFVEAGLEPFVYHSPRSAMSMGYRRAPEAGLDDGELLREWSRGSLAAAARAAARRPAKKATPKAGAGARSAAKTAVKKPAAKTAAKKSAATASHAKRPAATASAGASARRAR